MYNLGYHIAWCPKYRRKVLVEKVEADLKKLLFIKAKEIGIVIEQVEVMADHVHLFERLSPVDYFHFNFDLNLVII